MIFFVQPPLHQSLRHFERYACAAKLLVGIHASGLIGIDHRQRPGHAVRSGQVMIGDDQVDAEPLRGLGRSKRADAHIDTDDEANARGSRALDHIVAQVVALANAVGHMKVRRASAEFDGSLQDDDRHRAIYVVVAIDQDGLFAFDGRVDAIDGDTQASHLLGCMQMSNRREEETSSVVSVCQAAADEQARKRVKRRAPPRGVGRSIGGAKPPIR